MPESFPVHAAPQAEAALVHADVERSFIGRLVRSFAGVVGEDWEPHLAKMTEIWCSVTLKTRSY